MAFWIAFVLALALAPGAAPQSRTLTTSLSRLGNVRAVGAPAAANAKFVKLVSACAGPDALKIKALTALPNNSLRWMSSAFIVHLTFPLGMEKSFADII